MQPISPENKRPHFDFITLFPETIEVWLRTSILGRAHAKGLFTFQTHSLRDYSEDRHRSVDDTPYGGGGGMVLRLEPLVAAVESLQAQTPEAPPLVIHFSPRGERLSTQVLDRMQTQPTRRWILVCGHYEGVDQRFIDHFVDWEISLGDFVLTGGELPAVALADAAIRKMAGALASAEAHEQESFSLVHPATGAPLLEYPHYTRPARFRDWEVPPVLLGGDHGKIQQWRLAQAEATTRAKRPDLLLPTESPTR